MSIRLKQINTCKVCGSQFHPYAKEQITCSVECFNQMRSKDRRKRKIYTCEVCGKEFEFGTYRNPKYCSKECWNRRNPAESKTCPFCKKEFTTYQRDQVYCSKSCARSDMTGERATAWKGGLTRAILSIRGRKQYRVWRAAVLARDGNKCTKCDATDNLHAHHIKSFDKFPELRYDVSNGLTVCDNCHSKIHGRPVYLPHRR